MGIEPKIKIKMGFKYRAGHPSNENIMTGPVKERYFMKPRLSFAIVKIDGSYYLRMDTAFDRDFGYLDRNLSFEKGDHEKLGSEMFQNGVHGASLDGSYEVMAIFCDVNPKAYSLIEQAYKEIDRDPAAFERGETVDLEDILVPDTVVVENG